MPCLSAPCMHCSLREASKARQQSRKHTKVKPEQAHLRAAPPAAAALAAVQVVVMHRVEAEAAAGRRQLADLPKQAVSRLLWRRQQQGIWVAPRACTQACGHSVGMQDTY